MKRIVTIPIGAIAAFALSATTIADTTTQTTQLDQLSAQVKELKREVRQLKKAPSKKINSSAAQKPWAHYVTVTTTPFLGEQTAFDGSDLLYNMSSMNEDLNLLKQKKIVTQKLSEQGYKLDRPVLQVSGGVAGQAYSTGGFGTSATDGISLSTAELDLNAMASSWATAFMSIDYNGDPISSGNRAPKSTLYLSRGFLTFGDLNKYPVYFTMGKLYVPFGRYNNSMVTTPLTISVGRISSPAAVLGFSMDNGVFGSIYGFSGSQTSGASPIIKQSGASLGLKSTFAGTKGIFNFGGGWVSNIADAQGQQNTGLSTTTGQFGGFAVSQPGTNMTSNNIAHRVDAMDVHGHLGYGPVSLIGECISSLRRYALADMTYKGAGAEPKAAYAELDYTLPWFAKKHSSMVGTSYGRTWESLALNLPRDSYAVFASTSLWRETSQSIEYRHDTDYSTADVATGRAATTNIVGTGRGRNSVTLQLGVYF